MCDACEEFPVQYVAYFNKAGGKLWRPASGTAGVPPALSEEPAAGKAELLSRAGGSSRRPQTPAVPASRFLCEETRPE